MNEGETCCYKLDCAAALGVQHPSPCKASWRSAAAATVITTAAAILGSPRRAWPQGYTVCVYCCAIHPLDRADWLMICLGRCVELLSWWLWRDILI